MLEIALCTGLVVGSQDYDSGALDLGRDTSSNQPVSLYTLLERYEPDMLQRYLESTAELFESGGIVNILQVANSVSTEIMFLFTSFSWFW